MIFQEKNGNFIKWTICMGIYYDNYLGQGILYKVAEHLKETMFYIAQIIELGENRNGI